MCHCYIPKQQFAHNSKHSTGMTPSLRQTSSNPFVDSQVRMLLLGINMGMKSERDANNRIPDTAFIWHL